MAYSHYGSFGSTDPNFQTEEVQRAGQALSQIALTLRQSQDRQELQREAEIERFMREAAALPGLATSPYASYVLGRAGQHAPEVQSVIDVIKNRDQMVNTKDSAFQELLNNWDQIKRHREAIQGQLTGAPDYIPAADGIGPPAPNTAKQQAQSYLAQTDGMDAAAHALDMMDPSRQVYARIGWKEKMGGKGDLQLPRPLNFDDYPPQAKMAYILARGGDPSQLTDAISPQVVASRDFQDKLQQILKLTQSQRDKLANQDRVTAAALLAKNHQDLAANQDAARRGQIAQEGRQRAALQGSAQGFQMQLYNLGLKGNMTKVPDPIDAAMTGAGQNEKQWNDYATQTRLQLAAEQKANHFPDAATKARWAQTQQSLAAGQIAPMNRGTAAQLLAGPGGVYDQVSRGMLDPNAAWDEVGQMVADYQTGGADKSAQGRLNFALSGSHQRRLQGANQPQRSQVYSQAFGATHDANKALGAAFADKPGGLAPLMTPAAAREVMRKAHARGMTAVPGLPQAQGFTSPPQTPTVTMPEAPATGGGDSEE